MLTIYQFLSVYKIESEFSGYYWKLNETFFSEIYGGPYFLSEIIFEPAILDKITKINVLLIFLRIIETLIV